MKRFAAEKRILPEFPRTRHIPYKPNAKRDDLVASDAEVAPIFTAENLYVEEKVDGACCGMALSDDGHPLIRNSKHILVKGYKKDTPAKQQFVPAWGWFYKNIDKFKKLREIGGPVSVYGDWMVMQHGMIYNALPDWFITYDVFNHEVGRYLDPKIGRGLLIEAGFEVVPLLHHGPIKDFEQLSTLAHLQSAYTTQTPREGVYVKVGDGRWITHRFKLVRPDFEQGSRFSDVLQQNSLRC